MHAPDSPTAQKSALRQTMQAHRQIAFEGDPNSSYSLRDHFLKNFKFEAGAIVAGYHAKGSEIDPLPLLEVLQERNHPLALPVVMGRGKPLLFRHYQIDDPLQKGPMGILEPLITATSVEPDILLVPLLAFDKEGNRLGYGGGYYDRTLKMLKKRKKILAIGIGFSSQKLAIVPTTPYDVKLDCVMTELGMATWPAKNWS